MTLYNEDPRELPVFPPPNQNQVTVSLDRTLAVALVAALTLLMLALIVGLIVLGID